MRRRPRRRFRIRNKSRGDWLTLFWSGQSTNTVTSASFPQPDEIFGLISSQDIDDLHSGKILVERVVGHVYIYDVQDGSGAAADMMAVWGLKVIENDAAGLVLNQNPAQTDDSDAAWMFLRTSFIGPGNDAKSNDLHFSGPRGMGGAWIDLNVKRKLEGEENLALIIGHGATGTGNPQFGSSGGTCKVSGWLRAYIRELG